MVVPVSRFFLDLGVSVKGLALREWVIIAQSPMTASTHADTRAAAFQARQAKAIQTRSRTRL